MPELPEVETIRRRLALCLPGMIVRDVIVNDATVSEQCEADLRARLVDHRVIRLRRRGKYLIVDLEDAVAIVHLRMTGQLLFGAASEPASEGPIGSAVKPATGWPNASARSDLPARPARFLWRLEPGTELRFQDVRRFGRLWALAPEDEAAFFAKLGPEPCGADFSIEYLREALRGRRAPLKSFLLDQRRVAGVGNIYADEALFRARLHPLRAAGTIGPREARRLHAALIETLQAGIDHEGSSIESFVDPAGARGSFQEILNVYQRAGEPCRACGTLVRRIVVGGRGTHFCPRCQPRRNGMAVGG